jgi:hypothetical protein
MVEVTPKVTTAAKPAAPKVLPIRPPLTIGKIPPKVEAPKVAPKVEVKVAPKVEAPKDAPKVETTKVVIRSGAPVEVPMPSVPVVKQDPMDHLPASTRAEMEAGRQTLAKYRK